MSWRTAFLVSVFTLVASTTLLGYGLYRTAADGVTLSYLIENQHDCQAHVDLLHAAAKGHLTRDDFAGAHVVEQSVITFDDRGRYVSSTLSTSTTSP